MTNYCTSVTRETREAHRARRNGRADYTSAVSGYNRASANLQISFLSLQKGRHVKGAAAQATGSGAWATASGLKYCSGAEGRHEPSRWSCETSATSQSRRKPNATGRGEGGEGRAFLCLSLLQTVSMYYFGDGCETTRATWKHLEAAGFSDLQLRHFQAPVFALIRPHIVGYGVK
ncbi:hypothetical protein SRHO_G00298250 [Serrasalmus rhombeus]